jgi:imidazolonepropionase-like amidohydrolase
MTRQRLTVGLLAAVCGFVAVGAAGAQDLVISNARILDGAGGEIANGTIVVEDGVIRSVGAGAAPSGAANVIDAGGRTVMPGFIDAHRHLGAAPPELMKSFIDAGFTTVLDALGDVPALAEVRRKIDAGEIVGPRLKLSGLVPVNGTAMPGGGDPARHDPARIPLDERDPVAATPPDQARAMVDRLAEQGADNIKIVLVASPKGDDVPTLLAISDEAHKKGLRMITHTTSVVDAVEAAEGHTDLFAHTPHIGWVDEGGALEKIAAAGVPMVTTLGVFTPFFDGTDEHDAIFRDYGPFPWDTLHSAGQGPVNERLLFNAGVVIGYGTDTSFPPRDSLRHELRALSSVFSPKELVTILTKNAAICADVDDVTGTIEAGKQADLVMVDGDPLTDVFAVLDVRLVVKGGNVVSDRR